jgi:type II secretory ATPase GspE/PulE/Tfp pilus assembly ATPase PilB-like protein
VTASHALEAIRANFAHIDPRAVALLAERWARRHGVVPLGLEGGVIVVATSNPLDLDAERAVAFATGHRVRWTLASLDEIAVQLDRVYGNAPARQDPVAPPVEVQHISFRAESASPDPSGEGGASVIRLVDQLLADAIGAGVSDLHLEPEEQSIAVRHRVDGVLRTVGNLPKGVASALVSRVKILSGLDIADRLRPQDGRARVAVLGTVVDLRVSTLPASHGEKIVIRVLDSSAGLRTLESIGFASDDLGRIRGLLDQREGLILVTGPTGSGKTTTLYAALREIQARGVNVVTVEDPIEYRLQGIVQVQVHERAGLTFGAALRSIMRQDPDVILVGEIRDRETAEIAIQASLTGHLVLSTLHTNDAASAVTRLIDIGVPSYQIATAVKGVVAQRLVRRVCLECQGVGCDVCEGSGYRGRRAIAEVLVTSPEFERRVASAAPPEALAEAARGSGCVSLWESGFALVQRGETTLEELRRVAAPPSRSLPDLARDVAGDPPQRITILWAIGSDSADAAADDGVAGDVRGAGDDGRPGAGGSVRQSGARSVGSGSTSLGVVVGGRAEERKVFLEAQSLALLFGVPVVVEPLGVGAVDVGRPVPSCDAVVSSVSRSAEIHKRLHAHSGAEDRQLPLIVALVPGRLLREQVGVLSTHVDLVLAREAGVRCVLASILALLRWRGDSARCP